MKSQHTKHKFHWMGLILVCLLFVNTSSAPAPVIIEIDIQVSPHVINLQKPGTYVTVHTSIAYALVVGSSVTLNDVEISDWKMDLCGDFVAKFKMKDILGSDLVEGKKNTLTLMGTTTAGDTFSGSEDVKIINVISKKK